MRAARPALQLRLRRDAAGAARPRHRLDRTARGRRAGTACRRRAYAISAGLLGAKVKSIAAAGALRQAGEHAHRVAGFVVDQRVHADDVVELAERRVEHVAGAEVDRAAAA